MSLSQRCSRVYTPVTCAVVCYLCRAADVTEMSSWNVAPRDVFFCFVLVFVFFLEVQTGARHTPPLGEQENILLLFFPVCVSYTPSHEVNNQCLLLLFFLLFVAPLAPASCSRQQHGGGCSKYDRRRWTTSGSNVRVQSEQNVNKPLLARFSGWA